MLAGAEEGLSRSEANCVVEVGYQLMASGLAGAVGKGITEEGRVFVAIMHPKSGQPMFCIGKEHGRYVLRGHAGDRLADGESLSALSSASLAESSSAYLQLVSSARGSVTD